MVTIIRKFARFVLKVLQNQNIDSFFPFGYYINIFIIRCDHACKNVYYYFIEFEIDIHFNGFDDTFYMDIFSVEDSGQGLNVFQIFL